MNVRRWFSFLEAPLAVLVLSIPIGFGTSVQTASEAEQQAEAASRSIQQNDLKSAEVELRRAVELSPNNPRYLTELGGVLGMERKRQPHASRRR
jgi:Flp pilus assembly protein TadD